MFPPRTDAKHDYRVWNPQLIQYAGYKQPDGSVIGDPINVELTAVSMVEKMLTLQRIINIIDDCRNVA